MRVRQGRTELTRYVQDLGQWERSLVGDALAQRPSFDVRHSKERLIGIAPNVVDRKDVRMIEARHHADLPREALVANGVNQLRVEDLDGDEPVGVRVAHEIHRRRASASQFAHDVKPTADPHRGS